MEQITIQRVLKVGNSLAVILPVHVHRALGMKRGDNISFAVWQENEVVIRKLTDDDLQKLKPNFTHHARQHNANRDDARNL